MFPIIAFQKNFIIVALRKQAIIWDTGANNMSLQFNLVVIISLTLINGFDLVENVDTKEACLTDELYGNFTVEEYNNLIERRKFVRARMKNQLYRNETETLFLLNKLIEYPAPQDCKIFGPTIPLVPIRPISGLKRCILPPLPFEQPVSFPNNSDISSKGSKPFAKA